MEEVDAETYNHPALYYIAKSIDVMGKVDAVYFAYDWQTARGCRIERKICQEYGIKILEYDFLDEIKDEYQSTTRDPLQSIFDVPKGVEFGKPEIPKGEMPY